MPVPSDPMGHLPWDSHRNDIPMDKPTVVHGTYLSDPFPSHSNLRLSHPIPWDVYHGIPIGMAFPWTSLKIVLYALFADWLWDIAFLQERICLTLCIAKHLNRQLTHAYALLKQSHLAGTSPSSATWTLKVKAKYPLPISMAVLEYHDMKPQLEKQKSAVLI